MRYIGDIHGKLHEYGKLIRKARKDGADTIQVGDFGVGFITNVADVILENDYGHDPARDGFIRGNHDDPQRCKDWESYIPDGTFEGDTFFVGGAYSIDWDRRTPGLSWWPDEECSDRQFTEILDNYIDLKPRVMVTHDCPQEVAEAFFLAHTQIRDKSRTRLWLGTLFAVHQPELWVFGHWHERRDQTINGTRFVCIEELGSFEE